MEGKVAIIGGGISGLVAARQLLPHQPMVFEASASMGGVWRHCSYRSTRLQTPRADYEFSDYPWPNGSDPTFPTHTEILDYLHGYATRFGLWPLIRLNSRVVEIRYLGDREKAGFTDQWGESGRPFPGHPVWEVGVVTGDSLDVQGRGPEVFHGKVMHTLDYCKLGEDEATELMKGKKVVVVGYKKSAIDLATECAEVNKGADGQPCTMLIRTLHWTVPSYSIWGLPFFLFYSTRLSQFLHHRPNQSALRSLLCHLLNPMRRVVSMFIESYLSWKLPLKKYGLRPDHPFEEDYASCQMAILPEIFFQEADEGRINFVKSPKWWFWESGVELEDGTKLDADVVFLATGFDGKKKLRSVLPQPFAGVLEDASGLMPLYRGTVNPLIPNMAFVGYLESVSNLHTAELRCKWLAKFLGGCFKLPTVEEMFAQVWKETEVMRKTTRFFRRHCISTFSINHSDEICEEMGLSSWRKKSWLAEVFSPYNNNDYKENPNGLA
ncbi:hypothetical protein HPP92_003725 [Vanilla planifolia]|uniref:Flavin-containing monooxygenase n=1 Tax=Vanilla planifolia TaxID=51239 RepID=A0A835S6T1_VANPL|nr:hypothetical protein HPP92_003725 [Vanilla planifolia]